MGKFLSPQGRLVWSAQRVQFTNIPFFRFLRFCFGPHEKNQPKTNSFMRTVYWVSAWVPKYKQSQSVETTYELLNLRMTKRWTPSSDTLTPVARDVFECLVQEWFVSCQSLEEFLLAISGWWEKCSRKGLNLIKCLNNNLKFTFKPNYSIW